MKKKEATYALSLSYHHETKHYKIDQRKTRDGVKFAIERGPTFDNLMDVRETESRVIIAVVDSHNNLHLRLRDFEPL